MIKSIIRIGVTIIGFFIGYGLFTLFNLIAKQFELLDKDTIESLGDNGVGWYVAIFVALISFTIFPIIVRADRKIKNKINKELEKNTTADVLATTLGLIVGFVIAFLISNIWLMLKNEYIQFSLSAVTFVILGYVGATIAYRRSADIMHIFQSRKKDDAQKHHIQKVATKKVLDTSVIIDGRIEGILLSGFLEGSIIIPDFVLLELQGLADSVNANVRERGRTGLDMLNKIKTEFGIEIFSKDNFSKKDDSVDTSLVKLCMKLKAKLVTTDFNLNKVANIAGVDVLNINELALSIRQTLMVGERIKISPIKEGENKEQALAYLPDGTMIVIENGINYIGTETEVIIEKIHQTKSGKMIFAKVSGN